jgi:hypothetical protein
MDVLDDHKAELECCPNYYDEYVEKFLCRIPCQIMMYCLENGFGIEFRHNWMLFYLRWVLLFVQLTLLKRVLATSSCDS